MGRFTDWLKGLVHFTTPQEIVQAAREERAPREKGQEHKVQRRYTYDAGPMLFLGQQIVRAMQDAGYPARIHCHYRSPTKQAELKEAGRSRAGPWESPHQFYEAVDIIHASKGWEVSSDFWDTLAGCARIVSQKYGVELELGHDWGWDSAHIEIKDWRKFRDQIRHRWMSDYLEWRDRGREEPRPEPSPITSQELWERFEAVLPAVAQEYQRRKPSARPVDASAALEGR